MHLKFLLVEHFVHNNVLNCSNNAMTVDNLHIAPQWCLGISALVIIILIPILDRLFYPTVYCHLMATMFNRITAGMCFSLLSILCALILEVCRKLSVKDTVKQVNTLVEFSGQRANSDPTLYHVASNISVFTIVPQFVFQGVAGALSLVTGKFQCDSWSLEIICLY